MNLSELIKHTSNLKCYNLLSKSANLNIFPILNCHVSTLSGVKFCRRKVPQDKKSTSLILLGFKDNKLLWKYF